MVGRGSPWTGSVCEGFEIFRDQRETLDLGFKRDRLVNEASESLTRQFSCESVWFLREEAGLRKLHSGNIQSNGRFCSCTAVDNQRKAFCRFIQLVERGVLRQRDGWWSPRRCSSFLLLLLRLLLCFELLGCDADGRGRRRGTFWSSETEEE